MNRLTFATIFLFTIWLIGNTALGQTEPSVKGPNESAVELSSGSEESGSNSSAEIDKEAIEGNESATTDAARKDEKNDGEEVGTDQKAEKKPLDRPWIMKQRRKANSSAEREQPAPMSWQNHEQKIKCEAYLADIKENFLRARYFSIQGDPCNTARHAEKFLTLVKQCDQDCPEGFLEANGYTSSIKRNLELLYESGNKNCLGPGESPRD